MIPRPLSIATCGLSASTGVDAALREQIPWARRIGFAALQLDATAPGVRPRELNRSARRDLAALIRREGLSLSGIDLWIPPDHFVQPAHIDRAMAAIARAMELAAELGALLRESADGWPSVVSTVFPTTMPADALSQIAQAAERTGVRIADHAVPMRGADASIEPTIGVGIDPAAFLTAGLDPASSAASLGARLASARLCDIAKNVGGGRTVPGTRHGKLDLVAYAATLGISGFDGPVIADTRSLPQPEMAAAEMLEAWTGAVAV